MRYPNIDAERARAGLSLDAMAQKMNVSRKTVYNWINNGKIPQSALEKMAEFFGCSIDYLLGINSDGNVS